LGSGRAAAKASDAKRDALDVLVTANHIFQLKPSALGHLKNFSEEEIHEFVVPKRTLARRVAQNEPLTIEETDKAVRLARVDKLAAKVFGDSEKASRWLRKPKAALGGETPLAYLATEAGARAVEEMLNGIDHGIFA
jgi:putative toxin-antitoxin system antitoxin component (TIGR02293 family)